MFVHSWCCLSSKKLIIGEYADSDGSEEYNKILEKAESYLNENYPDGIEKKMMGGVIKEIKDNLLGADGKTVADCVKNIIKWRF